MSIGVEQLARLYEAANTANKLYAAARKERAPIPVREKLFESAREINSAYDRAKRQFKRQQKAAHKSALLTQQIKFYLDQQEAQHENH